MDTQWVAIAITAIGVVAAMIGSVVGFLLNRGRAQRAALGSLKADQRAAEANKIAAEANRIAEEALRLQKVGSASEAERASPAKADVRLLHWQVSGRAQNRGLILTNLGPGYAADLVGERAMPTGARDGWRYAFLKSDDTIGLHNDSASEINPLDLDDGEEIGEVPNGRYKARARWTNPDGTTGSTGWQEIDKLRG